MGLLDLLFRRKPAPGKKSRLFLTSQGSSTSFDASDQSPQSASRRRKDLLRTVLREVLTRTGIPQEWVAAEMLRSESPRRGDGIHVRLLVRHWSLRVLEHGPAFEQEFMQRVLMLDPQAKDWIHGFSWQFSLQDPHTAPPLPHPSYFTAPPAEVRLPQAPPSKAGDLIEDPAVIPRTAGTARDRLVQEFGPRDAGLQRPVRIGERFAAPRAPAAKERSGLRG
jgi:hypothetical protein